MDYNIDSLKRNLEKWVNKNYNESEDLKKNIIDALYYFKSFLDNEFVLMLNELSQTYNFKNLKEQISVYSSDSNSLRDQLYGVQINRTPTITFFAKESTNYHIRFNCNSRKFCLYINLENYECPPFEISSVYLEEAITNLDTKNIGYLRAIYKPISEILAVMKNQGVLYMMVHRCNEKIESLLKN